MHYKNTVNKVVSIKEGILLEAGFDNVTPNSSLTISSWAFDKAQEAKVDILDNRAQEIIYYHLVTPL